MSLLYLFVSACIEHRNFCLLRGDPRNSSSAVCRSTSFPTRPPTVRVDGPQRLPRAVQEPAGGTFRRAMQNVQYLLFHSVSDSSRVTYHRGWDLWQRFTPSIGSDALLETIPPAFLDPSNRLAIGRWSFPECAFGGFLQHMALDLRLAPATIQVYASGTRFFLMNSNVDIRFLDTSPMLRKIKAGIVLEYRRLHPRWSRSTLPLTGDMFHFAYSQLYSGPTTEQFAVRTAFVLAVVCLLRVSEYLPSVAGKPSSHYLRTNDVRFVVRESGENRFVEAFNVHNFQLSEVVGIVLFIRSGKCDQEGEGHSMPFDRSAGSLFDLAEVLYKWCAFARPRRGHPLMSTSAGWTLPYSVMSKACKRLASHFRLNPKFFRPHSIRYGGASMLAAAGFPDSQIQLMGRWKSSAFLTYIRVAVQSYSRAMAAIASSSGMTVSDLRSKFAYAVS